MPDDHRNPVLRRPRSYTALEDMGRVRLSKYFYMRDFLYSEIGNFFGRTNIPDDPELAIAAGRKLAEACLDPLHETFGAVAVRSAYRSPDLNGFGATEVRPQKCSSNEKNRAHHIWDQRDREGRMGACASLVIPWFADRYAEGRDWRDLAWWMHDHLEYHEIYFFPKLAAFNLTWREAPEPRILSYIAPRGTLLAPGGAPEPGRERRYRDFPPFRGVAMP